jgi:antitoxin ParD1/3/4
MEEHLIPIMSKESLKTCQLNSLNIENGHGATPLTLIFTACYMHNIVEGGKKVKLVTVLLPEAYLEGLDELVRANMYPSRSSVIRSAVRDLLKKELWEQKRGR